MSRKKYILTVWANEGNDESTRDLLQRVADATQARLTVSEYEPSELGEGYVEQIGRETLRKIGPNK